MSQMSAGFSQPQNSNEETDIRGKQL